MSDRIVASYLIESALPLEQAAAMLAGEQSSGTFVAVPGETEEIKAKAGAVVEALTPADMAAQPALPGARAAKAGLGYNRGIIRVSWPLDNLGPSLPNLVATVAGNLFELKAFSGIRILDIELPPAFFSAYPGPAFGVTGTRRLAGVEDRPLIGTIVKPSVGLDAGATADLVRVLAEAGLDFIKDDELQADGPLCPFEERVRAIMPVLHEQAQHTGRMPMFAFNLTGDLDQMRRRHDLVLSLGGTCIMASLNGVGLVGMIELRRHSQLPIHGHRNGWGAFSRHPVLGWSYVAWQKLWRLAGADHMHVNGLANKFCEDDESVIASARACLTPMSEARPCIAMPVFSSGQTVHQPPETFRRLGSSDLIYAAGGGVLAHPDGPGAGAAGLRQAWDAAVAGVPLAVHATAHAELAAALNSSAPQ